MLYLGRFGAETEYHQRCITFPWEAPEQTVIVERDDDRWRVIARYHPIAVFRSRYEALIYAQQIAGKFWPPWTVIEREDERRCDAVA